VLGLESFPTLPTSFFFNFKQAEKAWMSRSGPVPCLMNINKGCPYQGCCSPTPNWVTPPCFTLKRPNFPFPCQEICTSEPERFIYHIQRLYDHDNYVDRMEFITPYGHPVWSLWNVVFLFI
jgi:hypothetical protein